MSDETLVQIRGLTLSYPSPHAPAAPMSVLRGIDLNVRRGEVLGIAGESGSGKTQLLLSIMGLCGPGANHRGQIRYRGVDLLAAPAPGDRTARPIGFVFQDALSALHPYLRIGTQLTEVARARHGITRVAAEQRARMLLERVQLSDPARRMRQYPHELSGGMRQRVLLAMALMGEPELLLADEPTTALDVTVQAQVLDLLRVLRAEGMTIVLVTHDLGVLAETADRIAVVYAGALVELAPTEALLRRPRHPYTRGLLGSALRLDQPVPARLPVIEGVPPDPANPPAGCAFAPRCPQRFARCERERPLLRTAGDRAWACHLDEPARWPATP